jgi:peptidoglycan/LPS O-acetylase OafA/YrhL/SAM-dependent methyltransferase
VELSTADAPARDRTRGFHFEGFDGLRAMAAIAVAVTHSAFISGFNIRNDTWGPYTARLDIGVAVFFVISGFLLYRPFVLARFRGTSGPAVLPYFRRRFLRIFPAFWLVLTVVLLVDQFHGLNWNTPSASGIFYHYTLTHIYFRDHVLGPVQQSWTLATEIAFYVFLPVYAFVMAKVVRNRRWQLQSELLGVGLLYAFSVAFRLWLFVGRPRELNGMYNTWLPARIDLFALGMLLAVFSAWLQARERAEPGWVRSKWFPAACWVVALISFWYLSVGFGLNARPKRQPGVDFTRPEQMWLQFFWGVTGLFLVLPAVFGKQDEGLIRRFLTNKVVAWLGLVSYGIYLWHEAVIDWYLELTNPVPFHSSFPKMTAFMMVFTLLFAAASYYGLERPALRLKDRTIGSWLAPRDRTARRRWYRFALREPAPSRRPPVETDSHRAPMNDRFRLVLLSFVMLFVELALIRWTGSNVLYLSYFSNFVLLGSFLGIGIGFLRARSKVNLFPYAPLALAALIAFIRLAPVDVSRSGSDLIFFGDLKTGGPPREVVLSVVFIVVAAAMAFIGEGVGRAFAKFEPLEAYRLDLIGSVLGIVGFSVLSFLRVPPLGWGIIAVLALAWLAWPRLTLVQIVPLIVILGLLGAESFDPDASWSPYYKITAKTNSIGTKSVDVNGVPHQAHISSADNPLYNAVYERVPDLPLDDVLIIGAGGGNDVSAALAQGAKHVDAVEIDPRLYDIGKSNHPDRPYQDERVDIHINDGRAYLSHSDKKYDLVVLALPDSITLVAGQSSLRLESYLFTKEALESARDHLKPGGAFTMYNYYREAWLRDRFANTLDEVYGQPPCVDQIGPEDQGALTVLVASRDSSTLSCDTTWSASGAFPAPSTDNHPFPYLRTNSLPTFYLVTIGLILLASLLLVRGAAGPLRPMVRYADLFFMGAAFLLLETKNVVQFALLFGTTWFVNALVFGGVLLSVLVAVAISRHVTFKHPARLYGVLLLSLVVAYVVPEEALLELDSVPRFFAAIALAFFPIFTANLVFTQRFKDVGESTTAFGANLLGAMVGGLIEYTALIVGYRSLLIVVAVLYGLAFLFGREHLRATVPGASPASVRA